MLLAAALSIVKGYFQSADMMRNYSFQISYNMIDCDHVNCSSVTDTC